MLRRRRFVKDRRRVEPLTNRRRFVPDDGNIRRRRVVLGAGLGTGFVVVAAPVVEVQQVLEAARSFCTSVNKFAAIFSNAM